MNATWIRPTLFLAGVLPLLGAMQAAGPITRQSLVGSYDGHQMEVGAQLDLKPDGHFEYELAYGAMDETAKGTWELKDGAVSLTTTPAVVPPRFVVLSDTPKPPGSLWISMKPLMEGARQRVFLFYGPGEVPDDMTEIPDDGHIRLPGGKWPVAIVPEIPVFAIAAKPIPLTGTGGHLLTLKFEPNDIGKANFRGTKLTIEDGVLVMPRPDLQLTLKFKRQR